MPKIRKSHPPSLKAKVAVEAIKAHKTAAQIAQMFGIHPTQVGGWKKQALAGLPDIFGNGREQMRQQADADKDELYKQIGQLKVELDFLKKELASSTADKRPWIDPAHPRLTVQQQCELLGVPRSTYYYQPQPESAENLRLHAPARPVVHETSIFRQPEDGRRVGDQSQTRATADAHSWHRSALRETQLEPSGTGSPNLSVPAARRRRRKTKSRLEYRYYVYSDAWRLSVPGRGDGLVQPLRAQLGAVQYDGNRLLPGRASRGIPLRPTRNLELRSGLAVYFSRLAPRKKRGISISMDGRGRALDNAFIERLWRSLKYELIYPGDFATGQNLFQALENYFHFYNYQRPHQALRLPDAGRLLPAPIQKEEAIVEWGSAPKPPGFTAVAYQNGCFLLYSKRLLPYNRFAC